MKDTNKLKKALIGALPRKIPGVMDVLGITPVLLRYIFKKYPERKPFCPLPFKHMEIMPGGGTNLCCYISKTPGRVSGNNLERVYNSKSAREIRESIINGSLEYCNLKACPHFTAGNLPSRSNCYGTAFEAIIDKKITFLEEINLWLSFDSRCNLTCVSCRNEPAAYTQKEQELVNSLMSEVLRNLPKISRLGLSGAGDPFASPVFRKFLYEFDAARFPKLKIYLLANGLLFTEQAWGAMAKAQPAIRSVQFSVDAATKETYEKIRRGGKFETLTANLDHAARLRKTGKIKELIISFVINAFNFAEMPRFVEMGKALGCDQVYFSCMMNWGALSDEEYAKYAVHLPGHPRHKDFRGILNEKIFDDPVVLLGNVKQYRTSGILRDSLFS